MVSPELLRIRQMFSEVDLSSPEKLGCKERALKEVTFVLMPNPWETGVCKVYILLTFYMISLTLNLSYTKSKIELDPGLLHGETARLAMQWASQETGEEGK